MRSRRAVTYLLYTVAIALIAVADGAMPYLRPRVVPVVAPPPPPPPPVVTVDPPKVDPPPPPKQEEPPRGEVVFVLDTTSSMTGLIDGAKRKIWSIVNFIS